MKIELRNIGTIKQAEIDLDKNLLIFCGPNNSGKTYVAYTLYGAYNIQTDGIENILTGAQTLSNKKEIALTITPKLVMEIFNERSSILCEELGNLFGSDQSFFTKSKIEIKLGLSEEELSLKIANLVITYNFEPISGNAFEIIKRQNSNTLLVRNIDPFSDKDDSRGSIDKSDLLYSIIIKHFVSGIFFGNSYIAPAERIAINIFSKELSLKRGGLLNPVFKEWSNAKPRYSLPITSCLRVAEDLSYLQKTHSDYSFLAELIEQRILGGKINVSSNGEMLFNPNDAEDKALDIHLSASMVKSLSSLVFYFRHLAVKGDFIIIDEPELNLHPDNQIIMARILARIVNEGFKVLISTHSDYIITELNNLVRLNSRKGKAKSIMDKYSYEKEHLLDKDDIGVYLFKNNTATNLEVDEFGFGISTIEKVNSEMAQISESIYFDLFDKDDE